jgi:hypothetical protein
LTYTEKDQFSEGGVMEAINELKALLTSITYEGPSRPAEHATRALVLLDSLRAEFAKVTEELEEWRFTNKVDELQREVDQLRQQVSASATVDNEQVWSSTDVANACVTAGFGVLEANTLLRALKGELSGAVLRLVDKVNASKTARRQELLLDEQTKFEAWFADYQHSSPMYLERRTDDPNTYVRDATEARWIGWQACAEIRLLLPELTPRPSDTVDSVSDDVLAAANASALVLLPEPFERVGYDGFGAWHVLDSSKEREFLSGDVPVFDADQLRAHGKACVQVALKRVRPIGAKPSFWYDDCAEPRMSDNGLCSLTVSMEGPRGKYDKPLYPRSK